MSSLDISPELFEKANALIKKEIDASTMIKKFRESVKNKSVTSKECTKCVNEIATIYSEVIAEVFNIDVLPNEKLYWHIAQDALRPLLEDGFSKVSQIAEEAQKILNAKNGIKLKPSVMELPADRIDTVLGNLCNTAPESLEKVTRENVWNLTQSHLDTYVQIQASTQMKAGYKTKFVRTTHGRTCKYCLALAGEKEYTSGKDKFFSRHQGCKCTISVMTYGKPVTHADRLASRQKEATARKKDVDAIIARAKANAESKKALIGK